MKKNGFMEGAIIATIAIIISKVLGVLYVIPFYKIIGEQGGALYGYAYNIYNILYALPFPLSTYLHTIYYFLSNLINSYLLIPHKFIGFID